MLQLAAARSGLRTGCQGHVLLHLPQLQRPASSGACVFKYVDVYTRPGLVAMLAAWHQASPAMPSG